MKIRETKSKRGKWRCPMLCLPPTTVPSVLAVGTREDFYPICSNPSHPHVPPLFLPPRQPSTPACVRAFACLCECVRICVYVCACVRAARHNGMHSPPQILLPPALQTSPASSHPAPSHFTLHNTSHNTRHPHPVRPSPSCLADDATRRRRPLARLRTCRDCTAGSRARCRRRRCPR
ncbi:hypothetical protein M433DRAFT_215541 [Acidomyces richmondensis BFW]|nr:hypothetical protein M433DRAFT_215541 [Acidomyces richmondensis BFW]